MNNNTNNPRDDNDHEGHAALIEDVDTSDDENNDDNEAHAVPILIHLTIVMVIRLRELMSGALPYGVAHLQRIMPSHHSLRELEIDFQYQTIANDFLQFLLHYITSRTRLRKFTIRSLGHEHHAVLRQLIMAATQSECIMYLRLSYAPVRGALLTEFQRLNRHVEVLEISHVNYIGLSDDTRSDEQEDVQMENPTTGAMKKLILEDVHFTSLSAMQTFQDEFLSQLQISELQLGDVTCSPSDGDRALDRMIFTLVAASSATRLTLSETTRYCHFTTALTSGRDSVEELIIRIDYTDGAAKFKALVDAIPLASNWNVFRLVFREQVPINRQIRNTFLQHLEANSTLTTIQVEDADENVGLDARRLAQLQGHTLRNSKLRRLVVDPATFPVLEIPLLMRQLTNSPTGRFVLVRHLPVQSIFWRSGRVEVYEQLPEAGASSKAGTTERGSKRAITEV